MPTLTLMTSKKCLMNFGLNSERLVGNGDRLVEGSLATDVAEEDCPVGKARASLNQRLSRRAMPTTTKGAQMLSANVCTDAGSVCLKTIQATSASGLLEQSHPQR